MIYFVQDEALCLIKIGFTDGDPAVRVRDLQVGSPSRLVLLSAIPGDRAEEARLHSLFADAPAPDTEGP